ncbi:MAG: hypothetical protein IJE25_03925 [Clostridia bacterium]|nr:hypothetical protein [Clostridia bacterium]
MKKIIAVLCAILIMLSFSGCAKKYEAAPQITEGEFPFVFEYELNGQRFLIEDTVVCRFEGYDLSNPFPFIPYSRTWFASLKSGEEEKRMIIEFDENTESALISGRVNIESRVHLFYGSGGYYLGDPEDADRGPKIRYTEKYQTGPKESTVTGTDLNYEQLEELFGIKVIRFEFSSPIENTFE